MPRRCSVLLAVLVVLVAVDPVLADDEFTLYELLDPDTHRFAITFDVTTSRAGDRFYLNGVRAGSEVFDERVIDRATGRELDWELITGAEAKADGLVSDRAPDDARFIKVHLAHPVPTGGEVRLRIIKTYADPESYWRDGDTLVFERGLGIRANAVTLPPGYELLGSAVPSLASVLSDGRVRVSFLNDRNDTLSVRLVARWRSGDLPAESPVEHRATQDREITYWLHEPATHSFRISHDFTVTEPGQRYVHNFVRAGSEASEPTFYDLNSGSVLPSETLTGKQVNDAGTYARQLADDAIVIQAELREPVEAGHSVRIRVEETYTDRERYTMDRDELVWDRTLGRPRNVVTLPDGWMLTSVSTPAVIFTDEAGRTALRFINPRNDSVHVVLRAVKRPQEQ